MVIFKKNLSPPILNKQKTLPSSTIKKSLPLRWTQMCVPLLYDHIFFIGLDRSRPIFRSILLVPVYNI